MDSLEEFDEVRNFPESSFRFLQAQKEGLVTVRVILKVPNKLLEHTSGNRLKTLQALLQGFLQEFGIEVIRVSWH